MQHLTKEGMSLNPVPKVSVVSTTYNQERYIEQALKSFVMQKTNFKFEVIISDDCSTDGTPAIVSSYSKKYPDIFKPILRKKNVGAQKNMNDALRRSQGEYIALCEGDDYWTDSHKLQKQVDLMDKNPGLALSFHLVEVIYEDKEKVASIYPEDSVTLRLTLNELLRHNFIQTNSVMYRRQDYSKLPDDVLPLDWYLHLYHAKFGEIGFINEVMSVYRRHEGGLWWGAAKDIDKIWQKYGLAHMALYMELKKLYGSNTHSRKIIDTNIVRLFNSLLESDKKHHSALLRTAMIKYPDAAEVLMLDNYDHILAMDVSSASKDAILKAQQDEIARQEEIVRDRERKIETMKMSRFWKLRGKMLKLLRKDIE